MPKLLNYSSNCRATTESFVRQILARLHGTRGRMRPNKIDWSHPGEKRMGQSSVINLKKEKKRLEVRQRWTKRLFHDKCSHSSLLTAPSLHQPPPPSQSSPLYRPFFCWRVTEWGKVRRDGEGHARKCHVLWCPLSLPPSEHHQ